MTLPGESVASASLGLSVGHVVLMRAKEQVRWPDAGRVVTAMQNVGPVLGRVSKEKAPHHTMRPLDARGRALAATHKTVSEPLRPGPGPARIGFADLGPEPFRFRSEAFTSAVVVWQGLGPPCDLPVSFTQPAGEMLASTPRLVTQPDRHLLNCNTHEAGI